MGLSVVVAPQNSDAAAASQTSPVPDAFVCPSADVAASSAVVPRSDLRAAAATETITCTGVDASGISLRSCPVVPPASTVDIGAAASCESAARSELAPASDTVCTGVVGEAGSRTAAVRGDSAAPADRDTAASKDLDVAFNSDTSFEERRGSAAAAPSDSIGAASGNTVAAEFERGKSAAQAAYTAAKCASVVRTAELEKERELRLRRTSLSVGSSLTIGITSPLYASTLRGKGVSEDRRFCSKENGSHITAAEQRGDDSAITSESSSSIASRSGSKSFFHTSSSTSASDCRNNPSCRSVVDNTTASSSGTRGSATGGPASSSNSKDGSGSSRATAGGEDSSRSGGTGMFESGQCDIPASCVQAKEESQIPTSEETHDSAAAERGERPDKNKNRNDSPEESRSLRAAIGEGPLGKLLQRFGGGSNSSSTFGNLNSNSRRNSKNEISSTVVRRGLGELQNKLAHPVVQEQKHRGQHRQQREKQTQQDDDEGQQGSRVLTSHAQGRRRVGEEHILVADDLPGTSVLHSLQQQQLLQQRAAWLSLSEEGGRRISDPAAAGRAPSMPLWTVPVFGVPDDGAWKSYMGSDALESSSFEHSNNHASLLVLTELQRLRGEMLQLQVAAAAAKPANIIIQNKTEVAASTETNLQQPKLYPEEPGVRERLSTWLTKFFSSRLNQVLVLCGLGLGCYMLLEHWRHTWRMAQLRRRVDSNIVLRGVQMLEETIGVRRPQSSLYY